MKSTHPKLTVALLTYNRASYLKHAIDAILRQTYRDFELLILDNASVDNTQEIVSSFQDERITYVKHKENIGSANSANLAFELVKTDYLMITHDDDIMKPSFLLREIEILDKFNDVVMVSTGMELIDALGNIMENCMFDLNRDLVYKKYEYIKDFCAGNNFISCPTAMFRVSFMNSNKIRFREWVGPVSDIFCWFEINSLDGNIYIIKDPLYSYREHPGQDSCRNWIAMHASFLLPALNFLEAKGLSNLKNKLKIALFTKIANKIIEDYIRGNVNMRFCKDQFNRMRKIGLRASCFMRIKILLMEYFPYILRLRLKKTCCFR